MIQMHCIKCGVALESATVDSVVQPLNGLAFTSYGHFGSTVFDPMDGTTLEICICDECLTKAGSIGHVIHGSPATVPRPIYPKLTIWQPKADVWEPKSPMKAEA